MQPISFLTPQELSGWKQPLADFDQQFTYPLECHQKIHISHGQNYNAYFDRMGEARHALMHTEQGEIVAWMSFVRKEIEVMGRPYHSMYIPDLKVAQSYQGRGIPQKMYHYLLSHPRTLWFYAGCHLLFFVGIKSAKGTIMRGLRGFWAHLFLKQMATIKIYYVPPHVLLSHCPSHVSENIDTLYTLSSASNAFQPTLYTDSSPFLNFYFEGNHQPSKIAHVNTSLSQGSSFLEKIRAVAEQTQGAFDYISFALDERRQEMISALSSAHITTQTSAIVGGISFIPRLKNGIISLNTDEI